MLFRSRAGTPQSTEDKGFEAVVAALDAALTVQGLRDGAHRAPVGFAR